MAQRNSGRAPAPNSGLIRLIVLAVFLAASIGPLGIFLLIAGGTAYVFWKHRKKEENGSGSSLGEPENPFETFSPARRPARPQAAPRMAGRRGTPSGTLPFSGEQGRRAEELLDLLHAGIIERDEYHDRMRQLKMGKSG